MAKGTKTGGRKAGTPNKLSSTAKENIGAVFTRIGDVDSMAEWAAENRTDFYKLYARLVPTDVNAELNVGNRLLEVLTGLGKSKDT